MERVVEAFAVQAQYYRFNKIVQMENVIVQTRPYNSSRIELPVITLPLSNLYALISMMKRSLAWLNGELNTLVLLNSPSKQIVLTILHEETEIVSFQKSDTITFQVIEGQLKLENSNRLIFIEKGQRLTLSEKLEYTLFTNEETAYLLTTANRN
jgi:hypothetical protein